MAELEKIMLKVWEDYRNGFWAISIGATASLITAIVLYYIGYLLLGNDLVVVFLVSSFLMGGVYIASRFIVKGAGLEELSVIMARFVLAFSLFSLLAALGLYLPSPWASLYEMIVVSLLYLAVPIVAELGIRDGLRYLVKLVKKNLPSYVGLNWLFFLGFFAILSLAVSSLLAIIVFILIVYFYFPLYSLTGIYLTRLALGR